MDQPYQRKTLQLTPLVASVLCVGLGLVLSLVEPGWLIFPGTIVFGVIIRKGLSPDYGVFLFLFLAALLFGLTRKHLIAEHHFSQYMFKDQVVHTLAGRVVSDPVWVQYDTSVKPVCHIPLKLETVRGPDGWLRASGLIEVRVSEFNEPVSYGQRWLVSGPTHASEGMLAGLVRPQWVLKATPDYMRQLEDGFRNPLVQVAFALRGEFATVLTTLPAPSDAVAQAMLLGFSTQLPDEVYELFSKSGTLHLFAISGLHVGMIMLMTIGLLRFIGVPRFYWFYALAPILVLYVLMTGFKASAVRATIMALVYWVAPLFNRQSSGLNALAFAALMIMLVEPSQLLEAGFQFSFFSVIGLMTFSPRIYQYLMNRTFLEDPYSLTPIKRGARFFVCKYFYGLFSVSLIAWLCTLPLNVFYFNQCTPIAVLVNMVVVPAAFGLVFCGGVYMLCYSFVPMLSDVFGLIFHHILRGIMVLETYLTELPGASFRLSTPPLWMVFCCYLFFMLLLFRKRLRLKLLTGVALVCLLCGYYIHHYYQRYVVLFSTGYDVGALLVSPGGRTALINTGNHASHWKINRLLRQHGVNSLDYVFLTRKNGSAYGGLVSVNKAFPIKHVIVPQGFSGSTPLYEWAGQQWGLRIQVKEAYAGNRFWEETDHFLEVLHPVPYIEPPTGKAADRGLAIRWAIQDQSVLFADQLPREGYHAIIQHVGELPIRHLVVGNRAPWACLDESIFYAFTPSYLYHGVDSRRFRIPPLWFEKAAVRKIEDTLLITL